MKIEEFTEKDIREASHLAYPVWGVNYIADGQDLSFFLSAVQGCGKQLLAEVVAGAKRDGYENLYLWTDSSCNHSYYARHGFEKVAEFKSDEWKTNSNDYLTYIYRKSL